VKVIFGKKAKNRVKSFEIFVLVVPQYQFKEGYFFLGHPVM